MSDRRSAQAFRIHASNRLEDLARRLADEIGRHPAEPLEPERIVAPDALLEQWLRLALASHLGVAAHLRIQQPAEFAWSAMRQRLPGLPDRSVFGPRYLRWRVFERLGSWHDDDEVGRYLADGEPRKRFELADRLAIAYDRCRVYRPNAIRRWQRGESTGWHARLWAELAAGDDGPQHWVDAIDRYRQTVEAAPPSGPRPRVSFFHVATMSPSYIEMLLAAALVMEVHLYLLSPGRTFWTAPPPARIDAGYYDEESEPLENWGRAARDLQALLYARTHIDSGSLRLVSAPADAARPTDGSRLDAMQRDILGDRRKPVPSSNDDSLQIHVCHSATREVEVLHDRLLGVFDTHADIQPADVLLLTPDLDAYAPLVEAIFGAASEIDYSIGRQRFPEGAAVTAFLDLLKLPGSRYSASAVLAPLQAPSVRSRFEIAEADLQTIHSAVAHSRIRWARDDEHETDLGTPAPAHHSWRYGLRRLVLGYAMDEGEVLVDDLTPSALDRWGFHGGAADYEVFGRFHRYCELASSVNRWKSAEHSAEGWAERLRSGLLDAFFSGGRPGDQEASREFATVARLIDDFAEECRLAGAAGPIPFSVLRSVLEELVQRTARSAPRLDEGVTVAELATGQIFPAKVICLLGMNDGAFPRRPLEAPFDFHAELFGNENRRPGDHDVRDEDRLAFLEALLAARRCLLVTYTGRDLHDDKPVPPSLLVSELIDFCSRPRDASTTGHLEGLPTYHPLQPFSPRYFRPATAEDRRSDSDLWSFSRSMAGAARALGEQSEARNRFAGQTPDDGEPASELELEELIRFAESPTKHFLRNRLGLVMSARGDDAADDEPLVLDQLEKWQLRDQLARYGADDPGRSHALAAASGLLPPGNLAAAPRRDAAADIEALRTRLRAFDERQDAASTEVEIEVGGIRLVGVVGGFSAERGELLAWRIGRLRPKDRIAAWLRLLALTCDRVQTASAYLIGARNGITESRLQGPDPEQARAQLARWVDCWRKGRNRPLPFFPDSSWSWVEEKAGKREEPGKRAERVRRQWAEKPWNDGNDPCNRLIFGEDPVSAEFEELCETLLRPIHGAIT